MTLTPAAWGADSILLLAKRPHRWRAREQSHSGSPWGLLQLASCRLFLGCWAEGGLLGTNRCRVPFRPRWGARLEAPAVAATLKGRTPPPVLPAHSWCAACCMCVDRFCPGVPASSHVLLNRSPASGAVPSLCETLGVLHHSLIQLH